VIQDKLETEPNNDICEAVKCSAKVATTIWVKAGDQSIALNLCNSCISKFEDTTVEQQPMVVKSEKRGK
jgi:hypothetical protein